MDEKLREALSDMSEEDFYELKRNIEITDTLKELMRGENGYTEAQIMKKLDFTAYDMMYVMTGAYDFTVRNVAVIDVMVRDKEYLDIDTQEYSNREEYVDPADRDLPEDMNYGTLQEGRPINRQSDDEETVHLGGPRQLTVDELIELELQDETDRTPHTEKEPTIEEIGAKIHQEYLEKMKNEGQKPENNDPSIVHFN